MFLFKYGKNFYVVFTDIKGKRHRISCRTSKKLEAKNYMISDKCKEKMNSILNAHSNNSIARQVEGSIPSVSTLISLKDLIIQFAEGNLRKSSSKGIAGIFDSFIKIVGNKELKLLTPLDIELFKNHKAKEGHIASANLCIRVLKSAYNKAINWKLTDSNPFVGVKQFKLPEKKKQYIQDNEIKLILDNCSNTLLKNIIIFALYTGMRREEIMNIQWKDIDFNEGFLIIKNSPTFRTKSGKNRNVVLTPELNEMLITMRNGDKPDELVFKDKKELKLNGDWIAKLFKRLLKKLNLNPNYHFHSLRHTYASTLIKNNVPLPYVQSLLGHADIQTTIKSYTHIIPEHLKQSVNSIKMYNSI